MKPSIAMMISGRLSAPAGVTARAFRVLIPKRSQSGAGTASAGYMNLNLGLASTIAGENICSNGADGIVAGATAAASSAYSAAYNGAAGWADQRTSPGSGGTFWHSESQAAQWWVSIDFGAGNARTVAELFIVPVNTLPDQRTPFEFYFQKSDDGSTWVDVLHVNNITGWVLGVAKAWPTPPLAANDAYVKRFLDRIAKETRDEVLA